MAVSSFGCATVKGVKYTYQTLPATYIASARENPQTIDLTRLASATTKSNVLDRGDVAELSISAGLNEKDIARLLIRIETDGSANIPQVGRLQLAGMELEAAEAMIHAECIERGLYRNPNVTMTKKTQRMNRIIVAGAVKKPSTYELPRGQCDLLAALCKAEGLDPSAGTEVIIRNPGGKIRTVPTGLQETCRTASIRQDTVLNRPAVPPIPLRSISFPRPKRYGRLPT